MTAAVAGACGGRDGTAVTATTTGQSGSTGSTVAESGEPWGVELHAGTPALAWNDPTDTLAESDISLDEAGYVEEEYLLDGRATAYARVGDLQADGMWEVTEAGEEEFTTRLLVRRPADPAAFNGVVFVEWLNVSSGRDLDALFRSRHAALLREGYAWVGVSAQKVGVDSLADTDPERYATLVHPGDRFAFDIFTRAGRAAADPASPVLGALEAEAVIAQGTSQSASMLLTYHNAIQPRASVFDGFDLVSGIGSGSLDGATMPPHSLLRTDLDVPVISFVSESDVVLFGTHRSRQNDSDTYRLWEVAGVAHIGQYGTSLRWPPDPMPAGDPCVAPTNAAPGFVVGPALIEALARWVTEGVAPPNAPRLEIADPDAADPLARDEDGIARGGIRLPHVAAPVATMDGLANSAPPGAAPPDALACRMWGRTTPFTEAELASRYPTQDHYVEAVEAAAADAVEQGFMLPAEADLLSRVAAVSPLIP